MSQLSDTMLNSPIYSRMTGIGGYLPGAPVTNDELIARHQLQSSSEWIIERTGISARHLAPAGTTASDLAVPASLEALKIAGRPVADVDLLIVATSTPDMIFPSTAALLQGRLGIKNNGAAFDVQAVCSGFVYALTIADKFIRSGSHRCALVVGAEVFSRILDWQDRSTCVLFGDGAAAVVLEAEHSAVPTGILATALHADGSYHGILNVPGQVAEGQVTGDPFLRMDGQAVFKFAVKALTDIGHEVLAAAGMSADAIDWFVPHQANVRILSATAKRLNLPPEKCVISVGHHGNTSAASVPLAMNEAIRDGRIRSGQHVLLQGIGGGFTWGAAVLKM